MRDFVTEKIGMMSWQTYVRILNQHPYKPYSIKLNWRGEPLLHKYIVDFVKYAKSQGIHEVSFNTNATSLTGELIKRLCEAGLDLIIFSVDGATKETYEKIRKGADFDKVYRNIVLTSKLIKANKYRTKTRIQICPMPENEHEIGLWYETFKKYGDRLRIGKLHDPQGKRGLNIPIPKDCPSFWQRLTIAYNGDIMPCPSDYQGHWKLGNIHNTTIHHAWHSDRMRYFRTQLSKYGRQAVAPCSNCSSYC